MVRTVWGDVGLIVSVAVLGLADVDALMISMAKTSASGAAVPTAALAVAVGIVSNGLLKMVLAGSVGRAPFRRIAVAGIGAITAAGAVAAFVFR
jgi:uncharacterized membrane protein (DUF4010 family)